MKWIKVFFLTSLMMILAGNNLSCAAENLKGIQTIKSEKSFGISDVQFEHVDLGGVMSNSVVYTILQDHLGFMWFGTQIGLVKYDGYETTIYRNDPQDSDSLSDDSIYALHEDQNGDLWIGTRSGGLNRFDRQREVFTAYRHQSDDVSSLSHDQVYVIFEDSDETLWIGTRDGLNRFDRETEKFTVYRNVENDQTSISNNVVHAIKQMQPGRLWVGAGSGLDTLDIDSGTFRHYMHSKPEDDFSTDMIVALSIGDSDEIWLGRENGIETFNVESGTFAEQTLQAGNEGASQVISINTVLQDQHEILWTGTLHHGLFLVDRRTNQVVQYRHRPGDPSSLSDDMVLSIFQDAAGNYWIGTLSGVNYFDPDARKFHTYQVSSAAGDESGDDTINAIVHDGENGLWIGTASSGLEYLNRKSGEITQYRFDAENPQSIGSDKIWSLLIDRSGVLWVGTGGGGLCRFDESEGSFTHFRHDPQNTDSLVDDHINRILQDSTGTLWLATNAGLERFDPVEETFSHYRHQPGREDSLSEYRAVALYEDHLGVLWVGTWGGGLYALDLSTVGETSPQNARFIHYDHRPDDPNSLSNNNVFCLLEDINGTLWVGTQSGLNRFRRESDDFSVYKEEDGLPSNIIVGILENPGVPDSPRGSQLWLSTDGLSRFDPATGEFTNYSIHDGLASNNSALGAYDRNHRGEMFFGTTSGITCFHPDEIHDNDYVPPVVLTDFQIFNQSVPVGTDSPLDGHINVASSLELHHTDRVISFEYAALNYTDSENNRYAYMLEGLDKDWIDAGSRRFVTYTTLPPGVYTFRVRGSNNNGVWNEDGLSLDIIVKPPWWQTWWAFGLYVLCIAGLVFGYNYYRMLKRNRRVAQLEAEVSERTADLLSSNLQLQTEIRERQRADRDLKFLNQELEDRVNERTQRVRQLAARLAETEEIERQRMAAELHDQVSQNLVAINVTLEILQSQLPAGSPQYQKALQRIEETRKVVQQTSQCIRGLMDDLRPPALEEFGLMAAIRWNCAQLERIYPVHIEVFGKPMQPRLSRTLETALFRIAQEATNNALHHACADTIQINLEETPDLIRLVVSDDGIGFDLQNPPLSADRRHWGLQIMTERAESAGGNFRIETLPGEGVSITVEVKK